MSCRLEVSCELNEPCYHLRVGVLMFKFSDRHWKSYSSVLCGKCRQKTSWPSGALHHDRYLLSQICCVVFNIIMCWAFAQAPL
jgi:hypothetical protein